MFSNTGRHKLNPQYMPLSYISRLVTYSSVDIRVCVVPHTYCEMWALPPRHFWPLGQLGNCLSWPAITNHEDDLKVQNQSSDAKVMRGQSIHYGA